jgi:hypothetical protein
MVYPDGVYFIFYNLKETVFVADFGSLLAGPSLIKVTMIGVLR